MSAVGKSILYLSYISFLFLFLLGLTQLKNMMHSNI